jgi:hypothetical protein
MNVPLSASERQSGVVLGTVRQRSKIDGTAEECDFCPTVPYRFEGELTLRWAQFGVFRSSVSQ